MRVFTEVAKLQRFLHGQKLNLKSIGFVPTMGALHEGHLRLLQASQSDNDVTVCSIFVNPAQFNNPHDLTHYPRRLEEDKALLESHGCDVLFAPSNEEMYPQAPVIELGFGALGEKMEGKFRKGHFNGVGIIVGKLLNIINPDRAYFGQKDIQQFFIVRKLIQDLSFPVRLIRVPTAREADGLAMSSRNVRLTATLRQKASEIYQSLLQATDMLKQGETISRIKDYVNELFLKDDDFKLEYFEIADGNTLEVLHQAPQKGEVVFCIAVYLGGIRLIDNKFLIL